jgi:DnaJ-class molecular chaperone
MSERWNDITELSSIAEDYGYPPRGDDYNCKRCEGTGQIDRELMPTADGVAVMPEKCPDCKGRGERG